ncbi:L domain-like protein [Backusella circina FSU 941]|nr:L domain-like protein [Backusella circina FSU 941]
MGQRDSKLKESIAFGYLSSTSRSIRKQPTRYEKDHVLEHPELYGLRANFLEKSNVLSIDSCSTTSNGNREEHSDSGYAYNYDESKQLVNDLVYVDQKHYPESTRLHSRTYQSIENFTLGSPVTFHDITMASSDSTIREVQLSDRLIRELSPNIGLLTMIRKLDLSNNHLNEIPESIGYLQNLQVLFLAKNQLTSLPDTIGYLSNLAELDLAHNQLRSITPCIGYLDKLKILAVEYNFISQLPPQIGSLKGLMALDLAMNPLKVLPSEVSQLPFLRRIKLDGCPLESNITYSLVNCTPSLVELCARAVIQNKIPIQNSVPENLRSYIGSANACSSCRGPYFESYVLRGGFIKKSESDIPVEYRLCSAHWTDQNDRILNMFSTRGMAGSNQVLLPERPKLSFAPKQTIEKLSLLARRSRHPSITAITNNNTESSVTIEENEDHQALAQKMINYRKSVLISLTTRFQRSR